MGEGVALQHLLCGSRSGSGHMHAPPPTHDTHMQMPADGDRREVRQETEKQDELLDGIGDAVQSLHAMSKVGGQHSPPTLRVCLYCRCLQQVPPAPSSHQPPCHPTSPPTFFSPPALSCRRCMVSWRSRNSAWTACTTAPPPHTTSWGRLAGRRAAFEAGGWLAAGGRELLLSGYLDRWLLLRWRLQTGILWNKVVVQE